MEVRLEKWLFFNSKVRRKEVRFLMMKMNRRLIREKDTIRNRKTNKIFLNGSEVKNPPANTGDVDSIPGLGRASRGGQGNPQVFLPGESHGQRSLVGYSPLGCKELDMFEVTEHVLMQKRKSI